jgi:uncharacterized protein YgbK (DUF1537 family)
MENHPLTPMTDPDIRRWLQRQTVLKVGHLPLAALRAGPDAALARLAAEGARLVVADAVEDADLFVLGHAAAGHRLVTGGSGIAMGLPANFGIAPETAATARFRGVSGPALVLSGSCSGATRRQVAAYVASRPAMKLDASDLERPDEALRDVLAFVADNRNAAPLVYSTDEPTAVAAAQARLGRERLAAFYDGLFARLAAEAVARGFRRIVVAGGETSGAVAGALGETAFAIGPEIATGVPTLRTSGDPALALALKSGNFGDEDFFERALRVLEGDA